MAGPDLIAVGVSVDTARAKAEIQGLTEKFKDGKISVDEYGAALEKLPVTERIESLHQLGMTYEEASSKVKLATSELNAQGTSVAATAAAHGTLGTIVSSVGSVFATLGTTLFGYGAAHEEAAKHVTEHGRAHSAAVEAVSLFRHTIQALRPELATAGVGMGELTHFTYAARGGFVALAAALTATFIFKVVETGDELQKLKKTFDEVFGASGPDMLHRTEEAAAQLNTTVGKIAPTVETVYGALRRGQIEQQADLKKGLEAGGTLSFAPGPAGEAAAQQIAGMNMQSLATQGTALGKELTDLQNLFKGLGQEAGGSQAKAEAFFASMPKSAEAARTASVQATADLTKLFEVGGKGADASADATKKYFDEIKKGGLTSAIFDQITTDSREAAKAIAESFGYTGPEAVENFGAALDRVGKLTLTEFVTAIINSQEKIDGLKVPVSVTSSWDELKIAFKGLFEELAKGTGADAEGGGPAAKLLSGLARAIKDFTPGIVKDVEQTLKSLQTTIEQFKATYEWLKMVSANVDKAATDNKPFADVLAQTPLVGPAATWLAKQIGGNAEPIVDVPGLLAPLVPDILTKPSPGTPGASAAEGQTGTDTSTVDQTNGAVDQFNSSLEKTKTDTKGAADELITFSDGVVTSTQGFATVGTTVSEVLTASGQSYVQLSQGIATTISGIEASLSSFFSWLASEAANVSSSAGSGGGGGNGGPQLDNTADVGSNATGGIYTIGASGGVAGGGTKSSGTDSITLKGTVSPGELIAIIPADKANQATLDQLQAVINTSPVSVGGGSVSGLGGLNASELVAAVAGGGGASYPASLSDPEVKALLAQIKSLVTASKITPAATAAAATNAAAASGGSGVGSGRDPFAEINKQDAEMKRYMDQQQKAQDAADRQGGRSGGGAAPASRVASSKDSPGQGAVGGVIRVKPIGDAGTAANKFEGWPDRQDSSSSFNERWDAMGGGFDYSGSYLTDASGNVYSGSDNFSVTPDYASTDFWTGQAISNSPDSYVTAQDSSFPASDISASVTSVGDVIDIGENATGGIYTVPGSGGDTPPGYSGVTNVLSLTGSVSPGEIVAVIPAESVDTATVSQLQSLISNSSINLSGGAPKTLGLNAEQIKALLARIAAQIAGQQATSLSNSNPAATAAAGGGFNVKKSKEDQPAPQQTDKGGGSDPMYQRGTGASVKSRASDKPPPTVQQVGMSDPYKGYVTDAYGSALAPSGFATSLTDAYASMFATDARGSGDITGAFSYEDYVSQFATDSEGSGDIQSEISDIGGELSYDPSTGFFSDTGGGSVTDSGSSYFDPSTYSSGGSNFASSSVTDSGSSYFDPDTYSGGGDFAGGGAFIVPPAPGGGTDTVDTRIHTQGGEVVGVYPSLDALTGDASRDTSGGRSIDLSRQAAASSDERASSGERAVNVNVFGVNNLQQFWQSRVAIERSLRVGIGNG